MFSTDDDDEDADSSAPTYPCMPSLVALQQMRNRLNLAYTGKKLMKWTAMATGREMRRIAKMLNVSYTSYREDMSYGYILLARSRYCYPYLNVIVLENVKCEADISVEINNKSVSGVKTARIVCCDSGEDSYPHLGIGRGGEIIFETKEYWRALVKKIIHISELRSNFVDLENGYKNATKKKQLISRVVIPRLHATIRYIKSELEEKEREDTFRLKRFKQLKIKHSKKEDKPSKCCPLCCRPIPANNESGDRRSNEDPVCECPKTPSYQSIDSEIKKPKPKCPSRSQSCESCTQPNTPPEKPPCECVDVTDPDCECIVIAPPCECTSTKLKQNRSSGSPSCECIIHPTYCTPPRQLSAPKIQSRKRSASPKSVCSPCASCQNVPTSSKTSVCQKSFSAPCVATKTVPSPKNVCSPCESSKKMFAAPKTSSNTSVKFECKHTSKTSSHTPMKYVCEQKSLSCTPKKSVCKQITSSYTPTKTVCKPKTPSKTSVKSVYKQCEEHSHGKTTSKDELGTFETIFKEIVKVTRTQNCDGSISEKKEVITIRTETRNPPKSLEILNRKSERSLMSNRSENKVGQTKSAQTSCSGLAVEPKIPVCALSDRTIANRHRTPCSGSYDDIEDDVKGDEKGDVKESSLTCDTGCCVTRDSGTMTDKYTDGNRMRGSASASSRGGRKALKSKSSCCEFSAVENVPVGKQKVTSSCSCGFNTVATDAATRDAGADCNCCSGNKSLSQKKSFPSYPCTSCPSLTMQPSLDKNPQKSKSCPSNVKNVAKTLKKLRTCPSIRMSPSLIKELKTFFRSGNKSYNVPEYTESMENLEREKSNGCQATAESDDEIEINQCDPCECITMKSCKDTGMNTELYERNAEILDKKSICNDSVRSNAGLDFKCAAQNSSCQDASTNTKRSTRYDVRKVRSAPSRMHKKKKPTREICKCQSEYNYSYTTLFPIRIRTPNIFQAFNFDSWN